MTVEGQKKIKIWTAREETYFIVQYAMVRMTFTAQNSLSALYEGGGKGGERETNTSSIIMGISDLWVGGWGGGSLGGKPLGVNRWG